MGKGKDPIATLLVQTTNWCTQIAYQTMSSGQQRGMANNIINLFNHYQHGGLVHTLYCTWMLPRIVGETGASCNKKQLISRLRIGF